MTKRLSDLVGKYNCLLGSGLSTLCFYGNTGCLQDQAEGLVYGFVGGESLGQVRVQYCWIASMTMLRCVPAFGHDG